MHIRVLYKSDAPLYRALRLQALQLNPEAYGSTYEREAQFAIETVEERLQPVEGKFTLGAFDDNQALVGIVTFVREQGIKMEHKGNIYGMFVAPQAREQRVGRSLLVELIRKAKTYAGMEQINLAVVSGNEAAKRLYQSLGFQVYGVERNALKHNGIYYDEDFMVLKLS
ncbi:MAG: acetyltransferase [Paenibacillus sp.]|nr:acetyltransferase [Paenibacillus sp.]